MIKLRVATPEEKIYDKEVSQVEIKTIDGTITVLPKHIPLLTVIKNGYIIVEDKRTDIKSATVTVNRDSIVNILIDRK